MKYLLNSFLHLLPVVLFFVLKKVTGANEVVSTILMVLIFAVYIYLTGFKRREAELLVMGVVAGFLVEVGLGSVYREQFWLNASLWGIPFWLPLAWGMGFVIIEQARSIQNRFVLTSER